MKPYKIYTDEILAKEKGNVIDSTFVRYIGTGDSIISLFIRSYGHRHLEDLTKRNCEYIIYDKNSKHLEMFKELLTWDGFIDFPVDNRPSMREDFNILLQIVKNAGEKHNVNVSDFLQRRDLNATLGRITRHVFVNFKEVWQKFRSCKFTFINIDAIEENKKFLEFLYNLESLKTFNSQFIKLDFNKSNYDKEIYTEAINNILHLLWMKSFKNYQSVVELPNENNINTFEDYAGKLYSKFNESFCVLPWMHIQYKPNGQSKACCRYDNINERKEYEADKNSDKLLSMVPSRSKLVIQKSSMEESFYSNYWDTLREYTADNKKISGCHKCYKEEQVDGEVATSMRLGSSILYNDGYLHKKPRYNNPAIEFLEVGFGNYCNLACLSCNSTLSTTWHDDEVELNKISSASLKRDVFPKLENLKFLPNEETLKTLKIIKFTGGEPMINPEFIKFIDLICEQGRPEQISLEIYTNCSYIPSPKLLANLVRFKSIQLNLSIDAYGPANDYIRFGSQWQGNNKQTVSNSMNFWLDQGKEHENIHVIMSTTLSLLNVFEIPHLVEEWMTTFKESGNKIVMHRNTSLPLDYDGFFKLQMAFDPKYIDMNVLPKEYYNDIINWCLGYEANFNKKHPEFQFIPESINASLSKLKHAANRAKGDVENAKLFLEYLEKMDAVRGNSAEQSIPEVVRKVKDFLAKNAG